jgi:hypothetical protein
VAPALRFLTSLQLLLLALLTLVERRLLARLPCVHLFLSSRIGRSRFGSMAVLQFCPLRRMSCFDLGAFFGVASRHFPSDIW